jgi:hypothetical protein
MNTSATFYGMSLAPLCIAPFSINDFVYNPQCYSDQILETLQQAFEFYIRFNLACFDAMAYVLGIIWFPVVYSLALGLILYGLWKCLQIEETDAPLSALEAEITQYIHANASTGSTARMIYEHLMCEKDVEMHQIHRALQSLRLRGLILPVSTTLWVVSGN